MSSFDTTKIPQPLATLVLTYANAPNVSVPVVNFPPVATISWAGTAAKVEGTVTVLESGDATVTVPARLRTVDGPILITLADGSHLSARDAFVTRSGTSFRAGVGARFESEITLWDWSWATSTPPVAWAGLLRGARLKTWNLSTFGFEHIRHDGVRLDGLLAWHCLRHDELGRRTALVLLANARREQLRDLLWYDFTALEFLIGTPLRLDTLVGVDRRNVPVAAIGPALGFRYRPGCTIEPPVPNDIDSDPWIAAAFPLLSNALYFERPASTVAAAVGCYLDSTIGHIDAQYLFAQIGVEAFARALVRVKPPLVKDVAEWKKFIDAHRANVSSHAVDAEAASIILGKMKNASFMPTGRLVKMALHERGLTPPKDAIDELRKRGNVAHTMAMSGKDRDVKDDLRRLRMLRTLLAALILRYAGYAGALSDHAIDDLGRRKAASWFTISESTRARIRHYFEAGDPPST